jgi:hypothetical protein
MLWLILRRPELRLRGSAHAKTFEGRFSGRRGVCIQANFAFLLQISVLGHSRFVWKGPAMGDSTR